MSPGCGLYFEPARNLVAGSTFTLNSSNEAWSPQKKLDCLQFDAADLDRSIVLPVTVADLVLVRRLEFENHDFRMPPLLDDFSHDFRFRGVWSGQKLLFVGAHGQHFAKGDFPAYFAGKSFHLHGVPWCH